MAKGHNAADAHRKAQKAKEKKRNKEDRKQANELRDVKQSTGGLERDIRRLSEQERAGKLTPAEKADLEKGRADLARIRKAKEDYVAKNPDSKAAVFGQDKQSASRAEQEADGKDAGGLAIHIPQPQLRAAKAQGLRFDKKGRLLNPEKSAYFDPVFNPYGVPPPGMPYQAKPPTPEELAAMQAVAERSEDDDIIMPEDPKPDARADSSDEGSDSDSDDDNDIPMPDGPPPPQPRSNKVPLLPPSLPPESMIRLANAPTPQVQLSSSMPSHVPVTYSQGALPLPPTAHALPQRPVSRQVHALPSRPGAANAVLSAAPVLVASPASPASAASKVAAEPLSAEQLAQARAAAVISAAPQVRDLKKEATAFVPQALKRKRAAPTPSAPAPSKKLVQDQSSTGLLPNMLVAARDMRMPPGFSNAQSAAVESRAIDNAQEAYAPTISLHHGVVNGKDDDEASVGPLSPGTAYSNTLPGFDEAEDDDYAGMMPYEGATDVVGPSRPSQSFANTLPGYDEDDDDEEAGPQQDAPMPLRPPDNYTNTLPGYDDDDDYYDNRSAVQTYVEEEEEDE